MVVTLGVTVMTIVLSIFLPMIKVITSLSGGGAA
jgi:type II secretory pathway component PulF